MKFYSEITRKFYDTAEDCVAAEQHEKKIGFLNTKIADARTAKAVAEAEIQRLRAERAKLTETLQRNDVELQAANEKKKKADQDLTNAIKDKNEHLTNLNCTTHPVLHTPKVDIPKVDIPVEGAPLSEFVKVLLGLGC